MHDGGWCGVGDAQGCIFIGWGMEWWRGGIGCMAMRGRGGGWSGVW